MFAKLRSARGVELAGELLMLVIGINVALWFEGKFEDIKDAEAEQQYLQGLYEDLSVDVRRLESLIAFNEAKIETLTELMPRLDTLAEEPPAVVAAAMFEPSGYDFFEPSNFTYRSMQDSGDFRLLSDADTKKRLLKLTRLYRHIDFLQQNFIQALDDAYIPLTMQSFNVAEMRLVDTSVLDNLTFRNFYALAISETAQRKRQCEVALDQARDLLAIIEAQIKSA